MNQLDWWYRRDKDTVLWACIKSLIQCLSATSSYGLIPASQSLWTRTERFVPSKMESSDSLANPANSIPFSLFFLCIFN